MNSLSKKTMKQRNKGGEKMSSNITSKFYNSLTDEEVIEIIRAQYEGKPSSIQLDNVMIAIENRDYYVRPENTYQFLQDMSGAFSFAEEVSKLVKVPYETVLGVELSKVVRSFFDKEYYEEQIEINSKSQHNKDRLRSLLEQLSKEDVVNFYGITASYKSEKNLFIRNRDFMGMLLEFNEKCREIDSSIPDMNSSNYADYIKQNHGTYFDKFLDKETIIDILCKYINKHVIMAENMAEAFCEGGFESAAQYPEMVLSLQKTYPQAKILM